MLRIGGKPGQWCCRRQTEMCPLPGHLFSYLDLVLTSTLGFPSIDPACGLRLWKPQSKKARNHLFSIISNNQKNRLAQFHHLLPPFQSWTSVGGLGGMDLESDLVPWHCTAEIISIFYYFREYCWLPISDCTSLRKCQLSWLLWTSVTVYGQPTCTLRTSCCPVTAPGHWEHQMDFLLRCSLWHCSYRWGPFPWSSAGNTWQTQCSTSVSLGLDL